MNSLPTFMSLKNLHIYSEYTKDPKYKTEICKNWERKGSCPYNNKCRFAHGKDELMLKEIETNPNYRARDCLNFFKYGYCNYGRRCCFRHDERKFNEKSSIFDFMILFKLRDPSKILLKNELSFNLVNNTQDVTDLKVIMKETSSASSKSSESISTVFSEKVNQNKEFENNNFIEVEKTTKITKNSRLSVFCAIELEEEAKILTKTHNSSDYCKIVGSEQTSASSSSRGSESNSSKSKKLESLSLVNSISNNNNNINEKKIKNMNSNKYLKKNKNSNNNRVFPIVESKNLISKTEHSISLE